MTSVAEYLAQLGVSPVLTNNRVAGTYLPNPAVMPAWVSGRKPASFPFVWNVPRVKPIVPQPSLNGLRQPASYGVQMQNGVASLVNQRQTGYLNSPTGQLGLTSLLTGGL